MEKIFNQAYEIYLDTEWQGLYPYDIKQNLQRFLRRKRISYKIFVKYCEYSRKDFRKFQIIVNENGISEKSYKLCKRSIRMIFKKRYSKYVKKFHVNQSYPIILYHLGSHFRYYNKDQNMLKYFKRSGKLGFKKSVTELKRNLIWPYHNNIVDEEKFYKCLKFICDK
jgi:hypothetical protein